MNVSIEQQVPLLTEVMTMATAAAAAAPSNMRAYETEIEQDFQTQVQPLLQMYLRKTRRPYPINSVLDMSNHMSNFNPDRWSFLCAMCFVALFSSFLCCLCLRITEQND